MRSAILASSLLLAASGVALGQATPALGNTPTPAPFGFSLPAYSGTLTYSLTGSESLATGYGSSNYSSVLSGDVAYISNSTVHPFSAVYAGGYIYSAVPSRSTSNGVYPGSSSSSTFQSLAVSQVYQTRHWVFLLSDAVSYLPQSPTTGLSGIAGVGDIGFNPGGNGLEPDQSILTNYGSRVANGLNGSASWQVTARTSVVGSGSWQILHFLSGNGLNSNSYSGTVGPSYRIDDRNTIAADGYYTKSDFSAYNETVETKGASLRYDHVWSRALSTSVALGPQFTQGTGPVPIAASTSVSADASLNYTGKLTNASLLYSRGTNAGSGVYLGARSDSITLQANRPLNRDWIVAADLGFSRSSSLASLPGFASTSKSVFAGAQGSRRLGRAMSVYVSYTAIDQSVTNPGATTNAFTGLEHVVAAGITYSPAALHRGR